MQKQNIFNSLFKQIESFLIHVILFIANDVMINTGQMDPKLVLTPSQGSKLNL
jgi:hypothetical protein